MKDLAISQMMQMQTALYMQHQDIWSPVEPQYGRNFFLWMMEEIGEAISVIKKKGDDAIVSSPGARAAFLEEMADVLMYYTEIARSTSGIWGETIKRNMQRNFRMFPPLDKARRSNRGWQRQRRFFIVPHVETKRQSGRGVAQLAALGIP